MSFECESGLAKGYHISSEELENICNQVPDTSIYQEIVEDYFVGLNPITDGDWVFGYILFSLDCDDGSVVPVENLTPPPLIMNQITDIYKQYFEPYLGPREPKLLFYTRYY